MMTKEMHTTEPVETARECRRSAFLRGKSRRRNHHARRHHRLGASIVEFAIVANIVFLAVLISIEFVRMNMVRNLMQDAAYAAVRHSIVPGATANEAIDKAEQLMNSLLDTGYNVTVNEINEGSETISVTVSVNMTEVALFTPLFFANKTIEATATLASERYDGFYLQ